MSVVRLARNIAALGGFAAAIAGVAGYDWRAALIIGGVLVTGGAIYGMVHDPDGRERRRRGR